MGRRSVKEDKSIYMQAREACGMTREEASEAIDCITPSRLEKLENGRTTMQPEDVMLMAKAYREPYLCNYYCTHECAIGKNTVHEIEAKELPQIAIEMVNGISRLDDRKEMILAIAEDGKLSEDEYKVFNEFRKQLNRLVESAETLDLWVRKAAAEGKVNSEDIK
ncbi:MAG: helix-turn-helix transcriptional regulator [Parasporobacterium sp.]|nr:helix-turn-helix transcriptional regulator [Parasporobacterium sp.]